LKAHGGAGFWNNQEKARKRLASSKPCGASFKPLEEVVRTGSGLPGMLELAEGDDAFAAEVRSESSGWSARSTSWS